jgi:uncharacterized protein (TIGR03437 family)
MVPMLLLAYSYGPLPGYAGAPPDNNPFACASAGCHTGLAKGGPINAAGGSVTATFSSGSTYTPGQPVTITVNVTDPVNTWHGFQMTARLDSDLTKQAGRFSFTNTADYFVLCANNVPRTPSGNCPASAPVEFIEHNQPTTSSWSFTWTPPATNQGPVHFYIAGNAVNNDGQADAGDHVYTNSYVLQPPPVCTLSLPIISTARSARGFGGYSFFTSGSYLEIVGSNLAPDTRQWLSSDFNGNNAPTSLDGASVSINGKPGFVSYISPTQINVQAPADTATGPVGITVTNCSGTSAPATLTRTSPAPGLLAPPADLNSAFTVAGKQYMVATFGAQALYVYPTVASGEFQPAKPNDSIWLYGIGFGDTTPAMTPGVIATGQEVVNAQVAVQFGTTPATVTHAGLYPTFVGLYYFVVTVPNVADGDYQINVTVNGQPLQQQPFFLTVHH